MPLMADRDPAHRVLARLLRRLRHRGRGRGRPHRADRRRPRASDQRARSLHKVNHTCAIASTIANRQLHPLRKVNGRWQRLEWDDALDLIARRS